MCRRLEEAAVWAVVHILLLLPRRADVDRRSPSSADVDLCRVATIAVPAHLDAVRPRRNLEDERFATCRPLPPLAVDQHIGVGRLHAERDLAERDVKIGAAAAAGPVGASGTITCFRRSVRSGCSRSCCVTVW